MFTQEKDYGMPKEAFDKLLAEVRAAKVAYFRHQDGLPPAPTQEEAAKREYVWADR